MASATLSTYNRKRNFRVTPEPAGKAASARGAGSFVVQKHAASRLHYDFRLEWEGVLKSWAVPRGPSLDPAEKRMAVQVEDHPVSYGSFEGIIPEGQYGAGSVLLWDRGRWYPIGDAAQGFREGKLKFRLEGSKLKGGFTLVRMRQREGERQTAWLLIKEKDGEARSTQEFDVLVERGESVAGTSPPRSSRTAQSRKATKSASTRDVAKAKGTVKHRGALPPLLSPQLATLVSAPPASGEWEYELKLDGYRLLARVDGSDVRCFTRNGNDWSGRVPRLVSALGALGLPPCWLDGELVALDDKGVPDFQRLQNSFEQHTAAELRYLVFDLLFLEGEDLRGTSQKLRRERLRELLAKGSRKPGIVQFSKSLQGDPAELLAASRNAGFEGLVGKNADASYRSGRSRDWIKLKAGLRQEFVIGGYTDPQGSRNGLGSLLLGVHDEEGALRYAGNVGSGFDEPTLAMLHERLIAIETKESPFEGGPKRVGTTRLAVPHWVKPKLVAEVSFAGWTEGNSVRQAVFHGLRDDKPPRQITIERAARPPAGAASEQTARKSAGKRAAAKVLTAKQSSPKFTAAKVPPFKGIPGLRITHPERVVDAQSGTTKGDLIAYYAAVSTLILPHLKDRPVALLRAPSGVGGATFFQKHAGEGTLPKVERLPRALDPEHAPLLVISSKESLLSAAQMNVVELHTWNATRHALEKPDRFILDLDPGENVDWRGVVESAQLVRTLLQELKLKSFLKTSGGKGLHVVVPLKPALGWDEVKQFSGDLVLHLAKVLPQLFVAKAGPRNRVGRVFADYLRNGRGATTIAAWAARVRPGMGISVPLEWRELEHLRQRPEWNVVDPGDRLEIGNRPWKDYERSRQGLAAAMKTLASINRPAKRR